MAFYDLDVCQGVFSFGLTTKLYGSSVGIGS